MSIEKNVEELLLALNDAFACFDEDEDIEGAIHDLNEIQESLRVLLPKFGIYAWIHDGVEIRASKEEAEIALSDDIVETLEELDKDTGRRAEQGCRANFDDVEFHGYDFELRTENRNVYWKRMYDPEPERDETAA